jgi:hypothetical protein
MKAALFVVALLGGLGLTLVLGCGQVPGGGQSNPTDATPTEGTTAPADDSANADATGDSTTADDTSGDNTTPANDNTTTNADAQLTVRMQADFTAPALSSRANPGGEESGQTTPGTGCPDTPTTQDHPGLPAGADCDGDGASVAYITPSRFVVACKRLALIAEDGHAEEIIPDTGRLADAQVIDMTSPVTLAEVTIPPAPYVRAEAELYYYELVMPMNNPPADQGLRLFLSDDDFPAEGSLGHHQGDITLIDAAGQELGFVVEGAPWTVDSLSPVHQDMVYAGSTDAETGHRRGPFGDTALWDSAPFMQGPTQDIFIMVVPVDLDLSTALSGAVMTIVFNVADSWYYEDFDNDGNFAPCGNGQGNPGDACFDGGGWAPLFPQPEAVIEAAASPS